MIAFRRIVSPITVIENIAISRRIRELRLRDLDMTFAICVDNGGYEVSLELRKIYQVLPHEANDPRDYLRVIDESGEDYLYNKNGFELIELPQRTERKVLATLR